MPSLVILMIEPEQPEGLSARKLVAETAKHNVLTAYNADDGLDLLQRFPKVDSVLVHGEMLLRHADLIQQTRALAPNCPVILCSPFEHPLPQGADYVVNSHDPQALVTLLESGLQRQP